MKCPRCSNPHLSFRTFEGRAFEECSDCGYHSLVVLRSAPPMKGNKPADPKWDRGPTPRAFRPRADRKGDE